MRLLVYAFCNKFTGYGHIFRSLALARTAQARGHTIYVASDRQPPDGLTHIPAKYDDPVTLACALEMVKPDWLIVDVPDPLPMWIRGIARCKVCALNGIGYNQNEGGLDLRVIQGVDDVELPGPQDKVPVLKGIEYVILRPEIARFKGMVRGEDVVIWAGGTDATGLIQRFPIACPGTFATIIASPMATSPLVLPPTQTYVRPDIESPEIFGWLAGARAVIGNFGMIAWETSYLQLPGYFFSATPLHLRFARGMARAGLVKIWPTVGLPSNEEIKEFVRTPFEPWGEPPDGLGAVRVMETLERQ